MQNYAESVWLAVKSDIFPQVSGQDEKKLKVAFLQGMHSGRELVVQSTTLPTREMQDFNVNFKQQIAGSLGQLGYRPGNVKIGTAPAGAKKVNGN